MDNLARKNDSIAVYAFSADPITYGHVNIVERVAASFSTCVVGIGRNPAKQYMFDLDERKRLAEAALSHLPNVEVLTFEGMVVDFAYEQGARVIVKGVRTAADMEYEQTLHQVGVSQQLDIDTHILFADPKLVHVSSSVVKGMQFEHGFIQDYVPPVVKAALEARLSNQLVIGLTGDIAAGKSTLAERLVLAGRGLGVEVHNIDLDVIGHQVLAGEGVGEPLYRELVKTLVSRFGSDVIVDGSLDRVVLAAKVFGDSVQRVYLNELIAKPMAILLRRALKDKQGVILLNGALLPDMGLLGLCNYRCILCSVDHEEQIRRLSSRGMDEDQVEGRLGSQLSGIKKEELIKAGINQNGFGQLWPYDIDDETGAALLRQILEECEEYQWKA